MSPNQPLTLSLQQSLYQQPGPAQSQSQSSPSQAQSQSSSVPSCYQNQNTNTTTNSNQIPVSHSASTSAYFHSSPTSSNLIQQQSIYCLNSAHPQLHPQIRHHHQQHRLSETGPAPHPLHPTQHHSKRIKTSRACDSCRTKKIRCEPAPNPTDDCHPSPICAHCRSHQIACTWILPISETRFKRKRIKNGESHSLSAPEDHQPSGSLVSRSTVPGPLAPLQTQSASGEHACKPRANQMAIQAVVPVVSAAHQPSPVGTQSDPCSTALSSPALAVSELSHDSLPRRQERTVAESSDHRIYGSTSMSYIMHSTTTFPIEHISEYDTRYFQTLEIEGDGEGFIKVFDRSSRSQSASGSSCFSDDDRAADQRNAQTQIRRRRAAHPNPGPEEIEGLLKYFFARLDSRVPMVSETQFKYLMRGRGPGERLLVSSLACLAAMHHRTPSPLRLALRKSVAHIYRATEILKRCDLNFILSLLLMGFTLEYEVVEAGRVAWNAIGTAVRMAQSLGLHRRIEKKRHDEKHQEVRRRIWACCVIADRWVSAVWGLPMTIDLSDSDNLETQIVEAGEKKKQDNQDEGHLALLELSIFLGKVLKKLYTPSGILHLTDEEVNGLVAEFDGWECQLDRIADEKMVSFLQLASVSVRFLLYRPFMRATYAGPPTLKFSIMAEDFNKLLAHARTGLNFARHNSHVLEGMIIGQYSMFVCCLVQYHSYVRRGDNESLEALGVGREVLAEVQNPDCHVRRRVYDVVSVLYSTAQTIRAKSEARKRQRVLGGGRLRAVRGGSKSMVGASKLLHAYPIRGAKPIEADDDEGDDEAEAESELIEETKVEAVPARDSMWWWDGGNSGAGVQKVPEMTVLFSSGSGSSYPDELLNWDSWNQFFGTNVDGMCMNSTAPILPTSSLVGPAVAQEGFGEVVAGTSGVGGIGDAGIGRTDLLVGPTAMGALGSVTNPAGHQMHSSALGAGPQEQQWPSSASLGGLAEGAELGGGQNWQQAGCVGVDILSTQGIDFSQAFGTDGVPGGGGF